MDRHDPPIPAHGDTERPVPKDPIAVAMAAQRARLAGGDYSHPVRPRRLLLPIALLLATCASTFFAGAVDWRPDSRFGRFDRASRVFQQDWEQGSLGTALQHAGGALGIDWNQGLIYMAAVMGILLTHEMGHFLVALRHGVPASLPFFIPVPFLPFGTMGAVIGMQGSRANRRQMFDLGIAGPLAGLVVALPVTWVGIQQLDGTIGPGGGIPLQNPLIFRILIDYLRPDLPGNAALSMSQFNPLLMAGWVGMFVTGLNMVPISQLDGGHVSYALFRRRAHLLARQLVVAAILVILIWEAYMWVVMLTLVILMGIEHPATADDTMPLGWPRRLLGWASLAIPILCFPPMGFG